MSSLVYVTGHIKDPVPLIAKRRGLSPGGRFPPSFIHQVILITGLNKLRYTIVCSCPEDGLRCRQGVKPSLKLKKKTVITWTPYSCVTGARESFIIPTRGSGGLHKD